MKIYSVGEVERGCVANLRALCAVIELLKLYVRQNPHPRFVGGMFFGSVFTCASPGSDLNLALVHDGEKSFCSTEWLVQIQDIALQNNVPLDLHLVQKSPYGGVVLQNAEEITLWKSLCMISKRHTPFFWGSIFSYDGVFQHHDDDLWLFSEYLDFSYKRSLSLRQSLYRLGGSDKNTAVGEIIRTCHILLKLFLVAKKIIDHTASKKEVREGSIIYAKDDQSFSSVVARLGETVTGYQEDLFDFSEEPLDQEKRSRYMRTLTRLQEKAEPLMRDLVSILMQEMKKLV